MAASAERKKDRPPAAAPGHRSRWRLGSSWAEAVVVAAVLGVAGMMVGPRMSRGAGTGGHEVDDYLLEGRLRSLREAVRAYAADHGRPPTGAGAAVARQLLEYTDPAGRPSPVRTPAHRFGPYLRELPALPVGWQTGDVRIVTPAELGPSGACGGAWIYDPNTGAVWANVEPCRTDAAGREYRNY